MNDLSIASPVSYNPDTGVKTTTLSKIRKGEFFRFPGRERVYQYDGKVRCYSKWGKYTGLGYSYFDYLHGSIGNDLSTKTNRTIEIGFDF